MYAIYDGVLRISTKKSNGIYSTRSSAKKMNNRLLEPGVIKPIHIITQEEFLKLHNRINLLETLVPEIICLDCGGNKESGLDINDENYEDRCKCDE